MSRLIADIGGTSASFAIVEDSSPATDGQHLLVADFPNPAAAIKTYLGGHRVEDAVIAVATPVETEVIGFTNSPWTFSISALKSRLGLRRRAVINDFVAQPLTAVDGRACAAGSPEEVTQSARGGVFLAGGVCGRHGPLFDRAAFRRRFADKGHMRTFLEPIPVWLVLRGDTGLLGAAHYRLGS